MLELGSVPWPSCLTGDETMAMDKKARSVYVCNRRPRAVEGRFDSSAPAKSSTRVTCLGGQQAHSGAAKLAVGLSSFALGPSTVEARIQTQVADCDWKAADTSSGEVEIRPEDEINCPWLNSQNRRTSAA